MLRFPLAAAAIALGACGGSGTAPVDLEEPDTSPAVDSIEFTPGQQYLGGIGLTKPILASALDEDGRLLFANRERFEWSSSDADVVSVDEQGTISSVGWGTATVSASTQGMTATTPVTVGDAFEIAWSVPFPTVIDAGNVMGLDGTIYVGSQDPARDSSVWYAVSAEGYIRWTLTLPLTEHQIPAVGEDGTLYFGARSRLEAIESAGRLVALDPDGTVLWTLEDIDQIRTSPVIGADGSIYVAGRRHVYAVSPAGEIRWTYDAGGRVFFLSSPALGRDGTLYLGGEDGRLYAIGPDGSLLWTYQAGDRIRSSPSVGADGTIYFGSHDGRVHAVYPDGTARWSVELRCGLPWGCLSVRGAPSISPDGTIYVFMDGLYAIDPGGWIRWYYHAAGQSRDTAVLGADGTVYFANSYPLADGGGKGMVVALDPEGRLLWEHRPEGHATESPIIALDGTIVVAAGEELIAIVERGSTNGGYAASPWPTARGNRANTARAGG